MYLCSTTDQYVVICMHVIVHLRQQRGKEPWNKRACFTLTFFILNEGQLFCFTNVRNSNAQFDTARSASNTLFHLRAPLPLCLLGRYWHHSHDKMFSPPPFSHTANDQKLDGGKALFGYWCLDRKEFIFICHSVPWKHLVMMGTSFAELHYFKNTGDITCSYTHAWVIKPISW